MSVLDILLGTYQVVYYFKYIENKYEVLVNQFFLHISSFFETEFAITSLIPKVCNMQSHRKDENVISNVICQDVYLYWKKMNLSSSSISKRIKTIQRYTKWSYVQLLIHLNYFPLWARLQKNLCLIVENVTVNLIWYDQK